LGETRLLLMGALLLADDLEEAKARLTRAQADLARVQADYARAEARAAVGRAAYALNVQQFACAGLNYGYYYDRSPLIAYDGEPQPAYTMHEYTPSTVPGCRTPHLWLPDGRSLYDALGTGYTLLRFERNVAVDALRAAAAARQVPLAVLDVEATQVPACYRHKLLLSRPDQHVAWRGDAIPAEVGALVERIRGAGPPTE
jgi:hypothetical protein